MAAAFVLIGFAACSGDDSVEATLYEAVSEAESGLVFTNQLTYDEDFNIYKYRNYYNGGGVGIGDIDNDGLVDVYLTANMEANRLFRNLGDFKFEDITETSRVSGERAWSTGVSMVDLNADGWLDIYVCNSGDIAGDNKQHELFINNQDGTFTERAAEYGLDDRGYGTHAAFFDYDRDGDLDCYLLNNSYQAIGSFNLRQNKRPERDSVGGDKLFRNDNGRFVDVSEEAGIFGSIIGFGLGVTVGDVNLDNWPDIFVSNDFFERDYLYINQQDGTFREELTERMRSISGASMGADMADLNNDGNPEIFVTEMLPRSEERYKTTMSFENWDRYQYALGNGYYHQFTRNMLHWNNADGTFSEMGRMAGTEATDWSWSALLFDADNDRKKDIFVTNGIYQDILDQDYLMYVADDEVKRSIITSENGKTRVDYQKLIDIIPSHPIPNYAFRNTGKVAGFEEVGQQWGIGDLGHSNGAAYADLDNDGDLDLVVNNVNAPRFLYRNTTYPTQNPERPISASDKATKSPVWLKVKLRFKDQNPFAIGAKVYVETETETLYQELVPTRGFESSQDYRLNFGLGDQEPKRVRVVWPNGEQSIVTDPTPNQQIEINYAPTTVQPEQRQTTSNNAKPSQTIFQNIPPKLNFRHQENTFVDFDRDRLIYHKLSTEGPRLATADVNGDGRMDVFVGGAKGQAGGVFAQLADGTFAQLPIDAFTKDKTSEDVRALFFDADGDGDQDLLVASGGNDSSPDVPALRDRLYLNDGTGDFSKSPVRFDALPTGAIAAADIDADGDTDLFIGGRLRPFSYGLPVDGAFWHNDGSGNFTRDEDQRFQSIGMLTDARFSDYDNDGDPDLIAVGEYLPVQIFENQNGNFVSRTTNLGLDKTNGWYNTIAEGDFNGDGRPDFVLGNHGLNSRFRASAEEPVSLYFDDFDNNGSSEQVITAYREGTDYPLVLRHDLVMQMPGLKKRFLKYSEYKGKTIREIFDANTVEGALRFDVHQLASTILLSTETGGFEVKELPRAAQTAPIYAIAVADFDRDGNQDALLGGNLFGAKPEVGRYDASYGTLLLGNGKGDFQAVPNTESGLRLEGEIRDFKVLPNGQILVAKNNEQLTTLSF